MTAHKAFPIADVKTAMSLAKEPWLSPNNAFKEVKDARVFRSRIHRRDGWGIFASCGVTSASAYSKANAAGIYTYTLDTATTKFTPESIVLTWNDPGAGNITADVEKDSFGFQTWENEDRWGWKVVEDGTTNQIGIVMQPYVFVIGPTNVAATVKVKWSDHSAHTGDDVATPDGSMTWKEDPELPITGLVSYKGSGGTEFLVALNTTRLFVYDEGSGYFDDLLGSNTFTGTVDNLFWTWPVEGDLLISNGVDRVKKYDGAAGTLGNMGTTIGSSGNHIELAQLVVFYRNRVLYFNDQEAGTGYPRRVRWTRAGAYETLDSADFSDAPTEMGSIVTVGFISDRIVVGFQKGWMELVYTGDSQSLFEWEKSTSIFGSTAKHSAIEDGARILARTSDGISAIDPNQQYPVDVDIPDFVVDELDPTAAGATYGVRNVVKKQFWWSVVTSLATTTAANEILVAQYAEDQSLSWSRYRQAFNCFTEYRSETGSTWNSIDTDWDDYEGIWDSAANLIGFPTLLSGHTNGRIYKSNAQSDHIDDRPWATGSVQGGSDVGPQSIPFEVTTERLSPYPGQIAHLGWVDFYMEATTDVMINMEFRGNSRLASYKTASFSITPSGTNEKLIRRVKVNKKALFHTITVKATGLGSFAIDAVIPWFRPAGRMRNFG